MSADLDDLRREFVDALARSFAEGVAHLPDNGSTEITEAIRDLAMSSMDLADALDALTAQRVADAERIEMELAKAAFPDHGPSTALANYRAGREVWDTNGDLR